MARETATRGLNGAKTEKTGTEILNADRAANATPV